MPNGRETELDNNGCGFGQRLEMRTNFQDEKLENIERKQDKILRKIEELKENQDKNTPYTNIGYEAIKYLIVAVLSFFCAKFGLGGG